MSICLSFSLEVFELLKPLFLVFLEVSAFFSESLVARISLLKLDNFKSKVNYLGLMMQLLSNSLLSNRSGDYLRAYLIFLIPWNDIVKFINPINTNAIKINKNIFTWNVIMSWIVHWKKGGKKCEKKWKIISTKAEYL